MPLLWTEARKRAAIRRATAFASLHYVACRDFSNYNVIYEHSDLTEFYLAAAKAMEEHPRSDELGEHIHCARGCAEAMKQVGVCENQRLYRWYFGLMSGWRHTMLLHSISNPELGRIIYRVICHLFGIACLLGYYQGDDSCEVWKHWLGGPSAQSTLPSRLTGSLSDLTDHNGSESISTFLTLPLRFVCPPRRRLSNHLHIIILASRNT